MAITIKNIPVLEGAVAEDFIRKAEYLAKKKIPTLSERSQKRI